MRELRLLIGLIKLMPYGYVAIMLVVAGCEFKSRYSSAPSQSTATATNAPAAMDSTEDFQAKLINHTKQCIELGYAQGYVRGFQEGMAYYQTNYCERRLTTAWK
jgi:hypothetical protein